MIRLTLTQMTESFTCDQNRAPHVHRKMTVNMLRV